MKILANGCILAIIMLLVACYDASAPHKNDSQSTASNFDMSKAITMTSGQKRFRVSLVSDVDPIPLNKIHSWTAHVENAEGKLLDNAKILVYGGMPVHKHGLPTKPEVTKNLGDGNYKIDGVKFSMTGKWELWLIITAEGKHDKVTFKIDVN